MTQPTVFALADANNFFVSCERLFRPDLATKPVIVRSSNDGCVVSRSNEAKALGVPMGAPVFKIRDLIREHHITEFSGSFELYGDISRRLSECLRAFCPRLEVYSVDESFLDLTDVGVTDYEAWGKAVKAAVWRAVGIPVSIGIAPTKTLAKLASERAKKDSDSSGVLSLIGQDEPTIIRALLATPLADVWGVGWRLAPKLRAEGLTSAFDLQHMAPRRARQLMGIHGQQLVAELNGLSCYPMESADQVAKTISRTRMFGADTNEPHVLEAALASLGASACARLRNQRLLARRVHFFLTTSKHKPGYRSWTRDIVFDTPTADTGLILSRLIQELAEVFSPRQYYHRAGVTLSDLVDTRQLQTDLLGYTNVAAHNRSGRRMQAVDELNHRFGKDKIYYAAEDLSDAWRPRSGLRSPHYTTNWSELPKATILG